jgi:hypothetical protein
MCGYCIEKLVIVGLAEGEAFVDLPASPIYLQEAEDLLTAVREIKKLCRTERVSARKYLDRQIIMARLLEALWHEGIESRRYLCMVRNAAIQQVMHRKEDPELFIDACTVFPLDRFEEIYQPATYTDSERWELFVVRPDIIDDCRKLLDAYICRWLNGVGLEEYKRKDVGFTLYNVTAPEWTRLLIALPALIFSLQFLAVNGEDEDRIKTIVVSEPVEVGLLDASALWLQRKAVELLYDAKGLSTFLPYDPGVRQFLIAHLAQKKNFHRFIRRRLAKSIHDVAGEFAVSDAAEIDLLLS